MEMAIFITACAAFITGLANVFMIFEMKEQKRALSSPALKLVGKYCEVVYLENSWKWEDNQRWGLALDFANFGAGTAFNVSVKWLVEVKELLNAIKQSNSETDRMLLIGKSSHNAKLQNNKNFHAIPSYDKEEVNHLQIPYYYVCAFEKFIELEMYANKNKKGFELPPFPCLLVDISYEDINKNLEKRRYKVSFEIIAITSDGPGKMDLEVKVVEL